MSIDKITGAFSPIAPVNVGNAQPTAPQGKAEGGSFADIFQHAIGEVDKLQSEADGKIRDLVLKKDDTNTHDAMIALEKADVAFQLMNNIRAKIVRAYEDVIRTQV